MEERRTIIISDEIVDTIILSCVAILCANFLAKRGMRILIPFLATIFCYLFFTLTIERDIVIILIFSFSLLVQVFFLVRRD